MYVCLNASCWIGKKANFAEFSIIDERYIDFTFRFGLEFGYQEPPCGSNDPKPPEWWYRWVRDIHYLHFGVILFLISGVVSILVSLVTPPISEEHLYRLTFWTRHSTEVRVDLDQDTQYSPDETRSTGTYVVFNARGYLNMQELVHTLEIGSLAKSLSIFWHSPKRKSY